MKHFPFSLWLATLLFACQATSNQAQLSQPILPEPAAPLAAIGAPAAQPTTALANDEQWEILPAVQQGNLQIFLILGEPELQQRSYLSLDQALAQNKVKVKETGSVSQLSIDNNSDEYIFIHSGDIVKGGKQDRTLSYDMIVPPGAKNQPLSSFCVESGRWRKRAGESVGEFSGNQYMLSSKELKLAARYNKNQSQVWQNVAKQQKALSHNVSQRSGKEVEVTDQRSQSSLQLALENRDLEKLRTARKAVFAKLPQQHPRALGYAYAINGEIYGIDLYNHRPLFESLWEKLLTSVVVESLSIPDSANAPVATVEQVQAFLRETEQAEAAEKKEAVNPTTGLETLETEQNFVRFSTQDNEQQNWVHRNYMKAEPLEQGVPSSSQQNLNPNLNHNRIIRQRNN